MTNKEIIKKVLLKYSRLIAETNALAKEDYAAFEKKYGKAQANSFSAIRVYVSNNTDEECLYHMFTWLERNQKYYPKLKKLWTIAYALERYNINVFPIHVVRMPRHIWNKHNNLQPTIFPTM